MGTSILQELQAEAMGSSVPLAELLRKASVVAAKLGFPEMRAWCDLEINGYGGAQDQIPPYRFVAGEARARKPDGTWVRFAFDTDEDAVVANCEMIGHSVTVLEELCSSEGSLSVRREDIERVAVAQGFPPLPIYVKLHRPAIRGVLESVRNVVLSWTLDLEAAGVAGDGLSFSSDDKKAAAAVPHNVTYYFGPNANVQFSQGDNNVQSMHVGGVALDQIEKLLQDVRSDANLIGRLDVAAAVAELGKLAKQPDPAKPKVRNALVSLGAAATAAGAAASLATKIFELIALFN